MGVTGCTCEIFVAGLVRVALFACYAAVSAAGDREFVMYEGVFLPVCRIVAHGAVAAHPTLVLIILLMTAQAAFIQFGHMFSFMAVLAGYLDMFAGEREFTQVMVEFGVLPCICCVTITAILGKVCMKILLRRLCLVAIQTIWAVPQGAVVESSRQFAVLPPMLRVAGDAVLFCDECFLVNARYAAFAGIRQLSYRVAFDTLLIRYPFPAFMAVVAAFGVLMEMI